jgi:hypothetical protein
VARQIILGTIIGAIFLLFFGTIAYFCDPTHVLSRTLFDVTMAMVGFILGFSAGKRR